jgi:hypothetical protein
MAFLRWWWASQGTGDLECMVSLKAQEWQNRQDVARYHFLGPNESFVNVPAGLSIIVSDCDLCEL